MVDNKGNKKLILKKWVRVTIFFILTFFIMLSIFLILSIYLKKNQLVSYYNYNIKRDIDYKVYLHENDMFQEKYLGKNKQYISTLIDYIDIDFNYSYNGSSLTNFNYVYNIEADIIGEYESAGNDKEVWTKNYNMLENKADSNSNTKEFSINEKLQIKYSDYSRVVEDFKEKFKLSIDAYLKIKVNITYSGNIIENAEKLEGKDSLEINIPLTESTVSITSNYTPVTADSLKNKVEYKQSDINVLYFCIFTLVLSIIVFISLHDKIFVKKKNYDRIISKILKNYSEIIVEVETPLDIQGYEILDIKTFDDMVDLEEELKCPIMLYEIYEGKESWLIIFNGNHLYRFIINDITEL